MLFLIINLSFGQNEITSQVLQKLNSEIEKQIPPLKLKLSKQQLTSEQIEFSIDTFRIEQLVLKRMDIDYTTLGMNTTVIERTNSYDKLLNKYYNKLIKALNPIDKKTLVSAQKSWLVYRDNEAKLINTMTKEEYSGGGTIQSNIAIGSYSDLIAERAIKIFNYYNNLIKN